MRPDLPAIPSFLGALTIEDFESPPAVLFLSLLFVQGGGMDLSRVGEKLLSSVRSATSLGILPAPSDRPEVPARAAAAAAVARALAGIPPHQRISLPSSSEELILIYGSNPHGQSVEELEEDYYEEAFDPVKNILENVPSEEDDLNYFEKKATLRLAQLDRIAERLSRHVMEHHEEMVKGMQLVMELEQDLKVANVICMNGRRHLTSAMHEVSRDLVVNSSAKKKQALLDLLPILTDLRHALEMQIELETLVEEGNFFRAFQVLSEYLQVLDSFSELAAIQEMSRGVEAWLARALQKLDSLLLGVCQTFEEESYITVVDAYALIGDISGLAEKIQSFFMQEVLSETHAVLKDIVQEDIGQKGQRNRLTYSDLCSKIPESKFRQCLLKTMDTLFKLLCSYYSIMSFQPKEKYSESPSSNIRRMQDETSQCSEGVLLDSSSGVSSKSSMHSGLPSESVHKMESSSTLGESYAASSSSVGDFNDHLELLSKSVHDAGDDVSKTSSTESPFYHLRRDATTYVAQTLGRGRKNIWQLTTSRVSVLLSCSAVCSTSTHQFLRNYEDLNVFILAGEAFSGVEAVEFRHRLKNVSENYLASFHRQNIYALKMVLEKETWVKISSDTMQVISLAGLTGDGAPLIAPAVNSATVSVLHSEKMSSQIKTGNQKNGFVHWLNIENPFSSKIACGSKDSMNGHTMPNGSTVSSLTDRSIAEHLHSDRISSERNYVTPVNGSPSVAEDENEDLLADFIDEDSQLPSRISKPLLSRNSLAPWNGEEINAQTGSSLCLLRLMDKYARLMQKLEMVNVEFFKGICQLFGIFFHFIFETFVQRDTHLNGKILRDSLPYRLKLALSRVTQDCDQWIRSQSITSSCSSPTSSHNTPFTQMDVTPTIPASTVSGHASFGLKERCAGAETISLVAHVLHRSKSHLQSMLLQNKSAVIEDFFENLVDSVPDLTEQIHRTTARSLLHINGYADRIANAKWEIKELGLEHNGYVDLLLGEFKHYKTRLAHGGLQKEVQDLLLEYGLENVAEVLIEGLSRVKRCTDEGRALMSLDLQVLINGLGHFASINVKPKLQVVETFIKAYYLPETEYVHWARSHPEYTKSQIVGLINLVATNKGWKRKTKSEVLERIEAGN